MSNYKEQLQANNADLQEILETINNLSSAGGGTVETCTLTVNRLFPKESVVGSTTTANGNYVPNIVASVYRNGKFSTEIYTTEDGEAKNVVIEDVVCGSFFSILFGPLSAYDILNISAVGCEPLQKPISPNMSVYPAVYRVTAEQGGTCSLNATYD